MSIRGHRGRDRLEQRRTIASTETGGDDLDLSLVLTWGPEGTFFIAEVFGSVENGGVLFLERGRRHGRGDGKLRIKLMTASTVFKLVVVGNANSIWEARPSLRAFAKKEKQNKIRSFPWHQPLIHVTIVDTKVSNCVSYGTVLPM